MNAQVIKKRHCSLWTRFHSFHTCIFRGAQGGEGLTEAKGRIFHYIENNSWTGSVFFYIGTDPPPSPLRRRSNACTSELLSLTLGGITTKTGCYPARELGMLQINIPYLLLCLSVKRHDNVHSASVSNINRYLFLSSINGCSIVPTDRELLDRQSRCSIFKWTASLTMSDTRRNINCSNGKTSYKKHISFKA